MLYTPTSMSHRAMCETDLWSLLTPTLSLIDTDGINVAQKLPLKKKYNNRKRMENKLLLIMKTISMKKNTNMPVVLF